MSAKNYRHCPRCIRRAAAKLEEKRRAAEAAYGVVPADEYRRLAQDADRDPEADKGHPAFREDYEIGVSERGVFFVCYRGTCLGCDLAFEFKHEVKVLGEGE